LLDRDFEKSWQAPVDRPRERRSGQRSSEHLGWTWARKEVENYLIDPGVVQRAVGPLPWYRNLLEGARDAIADYQAARTALSACRRSPKYMASAFGPPRGSEKHEFPDDVSESACRAGLKTVIEGHATDQAPSVEEATLTFESLLPECRKGGRPAQILPARLCGEGLALADGLLPQKQGIQ
ncbi:MAG: hypothetical protein AB1758_36820, partial [Candidatus Eremiobacterota bacterium]